MRQKESTTQVSNKMLLNFGKKEKIKRKEVH